MKKISDYEKEMGMTYMEAKQFLMEVGEWENMKKQLLSLDGYSIIAYAKRIKGKQWKGKSNEPI